MFFRKSNKNCSENLTIKQRLERLNPAQVCGLALLYIDYHLCSAEDTATDRNAQARLGVSMLFEAVQTTSLKESFSDDRDFGYQILAFVNKDGGWQTIDCFIDWLNITSGTGKMHFQRRAEIIKIFKVVLEEYYELPVGRIVKFLST